MKNILLITLWITLISLSDLLVAQNTSVASQDEQCIQSFDDFAYHSSSRKLEENVTYLPHWQIEAELPRKEVSDDSPFDYYQGLEVSLAKFHNGQEEIWITGGIYDYKRMQTNPIIIVYYPDSHDWEYVIPNIGDTGLYAKELFLDSNGVIWGRTTWEPIQERRVLGKFPVLSRFDEHTRRFEIAEGVLEESPIQRPLGRDQTVYVSEHRAMIILDDDMFWIIIGDDGIYRYDPSMQVTEKQADLHGIFIDSAALSPDGSIYFWTGDNGVKPDIIDLFATASGNLSQFIPQTRKIVSLGMPGTPNAMWPRFSALLVDSNGTLWMGSSGFRDVDGNWHLMHPNPEEFIENDRNYPWRLPWPIYESSDGKIWFKKWLDQDGRGEGTAWYDPQLGEGCLITSYAANIIEDANQQLWMVVDGILYSNKI
jgi:hypothetical protein